MKIIREAVHGVLDEYLCGDLMKDIEKQIVDDVRGGLEKHEPTRLMAETDFHDCVNELCMRCGQYKQEHNGVCDGCRWLKPRRGW